MKKGSSLKNFIVVITAVAILLFTYVATVTEIKRMNRLKISKQDSLNVKLNLVEGKMVEIQKALFDKAYELRSKKWFITDELLTSFGPRLREEGGFYQVGWNKSKESVEALKEYGATVRCVLPSKDARICFHSGKPSECDILIAKAY